MSSNLVDVVNEYITSFALNVNQIESLLCLVKIPKIAKISTYNEFFTILKSALVSKIRPLDVIEIIKNTQMCTPGIWAKFLEIDNSNVEMEVMCELEEKEDETDTTSLL